MSASMQTILVVGGTSGIGEVFAKRWHSQGKNIIVTGRRKDKLAALENSHSSLKGYAMDNTDLSALHGHVNSLFETFPDIDTVWINSGIGSMSSLSDPSTSSDAQYIAEITTNVTAPVILARYILPRLLARAPAHAAFLVTGSGMGFVPSGGFPVYAPTKAFIHHFMVGLRGTLQGSNVSVVELVPPFVDTSMHTEYESKLKGVPRLTMDEYVEETSAQLDGTAVEELKEVAAGSAKDRVQVWRGSVGRYMEERKMAG